MREAGYDLGTTTRRGTNTETVQGGDRNHRRVPTARYTRRRDREDQENGEDAR